MRALLVASFALCALSVFACDGGGSTPRGTPAPSTEPVNARRSGITEVDAIIDALIAGDGDRLVQLIEFQKIACVGPTPGNIGGPPLCTDYDVPEGTKLEVLPSAQCEPYYLARSDVAGTARDESLEVYAVYPTDDGYGIVFSRTTQTGQTLGSLFSVRDGRIVSADHGCGDSPAMLVDHLTQEQFVLPPP